MKSRENFISFQFVHANTHIHTLYYNITLTVFALSCLSLFYPHNIPLKMLFLYYMSFVKFSSQWINGSLHELVSLSWLVKKQEKKEEEKTRRMKVKYRTSILDGWNNKFHSRAQSSHKTFFKTIELIIFIYRNDTALYSTSIVNFIVKVFISHLKVFQFKFVFHFLFHRTKKQLHLDTSIFYKDFYNSN